MRMKASHALGAAMLTLALAGCGGGGSSSEPPIVIPPVSVAPTPSPTPSPTPAPSPAPTPSALTQADARLGACVNLGNHLEPPNEGDWGRLLTDQDFADLKAKGFRTVRLPVRFSSHQGASPNYVIEPAFLDRVEHLVDVARANGLRIIVDNHNFDELMANPSARTAQLTAIWTQVADRLKNKDSEVWFELMNEPNASLVNTNLVATLGPSVTEIRKTNPTRTVVIGGETWSSIYSLATVPIFNDARIVYTFHYYDPFNFTHQGAPWITPSPPPFGATFGSTADKAELAANVVRAQEFMTRTGRPLFMGEYGAWEGISLPERVAYYKAVHDAFGAADVDQCVWAYVNTFPIRDASTGAWYETLLDAIGL